MSDNFVHRLLGCVILLLISHSYSHAQIAVQFRVTANNKPLQLNDSSYTNAFNESYRVTRLKYYINDISLHAYDGFVFYDKPSLLDAGNTDSIVMPENPGTYYMIEFNVGLDSALNCSGAQAGALDPLNGMFWTWNSGYIFFKLEGYSPSSTGDLQRIEHHVGGYRYPNAVQRHVTLKLPVPLVSKKGSQNKIIINVDLDKYWKGINDIKIAEQALLMTPGGLAIKAADNFPGMFSITSVQ